MEKLSLDPIVLIAAILLGLTLTGYFIGELPYPFGIFVLLLILIARIHYLRNKNSGN